MRRRHVIIALATPMFAISCAPSGNEPPSAQPPAGAVTANAAFPPVGSKWKVRVTENASPPRDEEHMAIAGEFNGHPAYEIAGPTTTSALNPITFNLMGTIKDGKVATLSTPDFEGFSWPLWVGKSWVVRSAFQDVERGRFFEAYPYPVKVAAYEDVTVPAGTFKAFRIEIGGTSNASHTTSWYAPAVKFIVKQISQRYSTYYLGAGETTTELLTIPK